MKPFIKDGYIHCLAMFKPEHVTDDDWEAMSLDERDKTADWTQARYPMDVFSYNKASYKLSSTLRYDNGFSITIQCTIEDLDKLLKPKNPIVVSYMNTILSDIDGAISDDEEIGGLKDIAYPMPVHPKFMDALSELKEYGISHEEVFDQEGNRYLQITW